MKPGNELPGATQADIEAAVRQYLGRVARRYTPLIVGLVVLALVVALVPTVNQKAKTTGRQFAAGNSRVEGEQQLATQGPTDTTPGAPGAPAGPAASSGGGGGGGGPAALPKTITPPAAAGTRGKTRGGVDCGPGVRQLPWTQYGPICIPAYSGNNGGSTSPGVSADAIKLAFRKTNSAEEKAAFAAVGDAAPDSDDKWLYDLRTYFDLFNKYGELYGRKVVVQDYNGQGDNLEEDQGRRLEGAQADASTAKSIGAFGDITQSPTLALTQPYAEDLANNKIVVFGALALPLAWYKKYAPFEFSPIPDGGKAAKGAVNALCARAAGMPAIFAGDPVYQKQNRAFGMITPNNDVYKQIGNDIEAGMKAQCGQAIAKRVDYAIDVTQEEQEAVSIVAQMKTNNPPVTTLVCVCDPVMEVFMGNAADQQKYSPEWFMSPWGDPQGRSVSQTQMAHALSGSGSVLPKQQRESYKAWKMIKPNEEPQDKYFDLAYYFALYTYTLLQGAGPNLTPPAVQQGAFSMPRSGRGEAGIWSGGPDAYTSATESQVGKWATDRPSGFDGKNGGWFSCEGGTFFPFDDPKAFGPRRQLDCK